LHSDPGQLPAENGNYDRQFLSGRQRRFLNYVRSQAGSTLWVSLGMLLYVVAIAALCDAAALPGDFHAGIYAVAFLEMYVLFSVTIFAILLLRHHTGRSDQPLLWFDRTWHPREFLDRLAGALPILLVMPFFKAAFTAAKNLANDMFAFAWDRTLSDLDKVLHFGSHPWQWLFIPAPAVTLGLEFFYAFWGVALVVIPYAVSLRRPDCPWRTQFLVSYVLVFLLLGNVVASAFMSAGPFWVENHHPGRSDYSALFSYLSQVDSVWRFSAVKFQHYLIVTHNEALSSLGTGISAFPSIHVAIATLYALVGWRISRFARVVSLAFLATILVGSIHLGWHYSLDGYASIIGTCAIYRAVGWALRRGAPLLRDRRPTGNPAAVG
jgi:hypothetical protein